MQHPGRLVSKRCLICTSGAAESGTYLRLGDKWWLSDETEANRPSVLPALYRYMAFCGAIGTACVASVFTFSQCGALQWTATAQQVVCSPGVPQAALAVWRIGAALSITSLTIVRCVRDSNGLLEDLDRRGRWFSYSGVWRFQGLTGWSWLLINLYFLLVAGLTLSPNTLTSTTPSLAANACQALLGTAFAFALLVTAVVTFVLIPNRQAQGLSVIEYFRFQPLVMHNFNLAAMGMELWLSELTVQLEMLPIALLFGLIYVTYHNTYRYFKTRTLLYFFLNPTRDDALRIICILLASFSVAFTCGYAVSTFLRSTWWGAPCFALVLVSLMKVQQEQPQAAPPPAATG